MSAMPIAAARLPEPKIRASASRTARMPTHLPLSCWLIGTGILSSANPIAAIIAPKMIHIAARIVPPIGIRFISVDAPGKSVPSRAEIPCEKSRMIIPCIILNSPSINAIMAPILIRREDTFGSICSMSLFL